MYTVNPEYVRSKYNLRMLRDIENYVAELVDVQVPFSNYVTGFSAFTHKAGIHAKAILNNPSTYEVISNFAIQNVNDQILKPEDFGVTRYVHIAHRLTGWNAIKNRAEQLNLQLTDDDIKEVTNKIKALADIKQQSLDDVDSLLRHYHENRSN